MRRFVRVSSIFPAGKAAVISTSPPVRNLKKRFACSFSWSAVSSKIRAIWTKPSFRAWEPFPSACH
jgi:hypothetical protein